MSAVQIRYRPPFFRSRRLGFTGAFCFCARRTGSPNLGPVITQSLRIGDRFVTLAQSSFKSTTGRICSTAFYCFSAAPPFRVSAATSLPFELSNLKGGAVKLPRLNAEVAEVVYPCGMVAAGSDLVISYGINDEGCAIAVVPAAKVEALEPVNGGFAYANLSQVTQPKPMPKDSNYAATRAVTPMWWDCLGKKVGGTIGNRECKIGNFGDIASRDIVAALLKRPTARQSNWFALPLPALGVTFVVS